MTINSIYLHHFKKHSQSYNSKFLVINKSTHVNHKILIKLSYLKIYFLKHSTQLLESLFLSMKHCIGLLSRIYSM